MEPNLPIYGLAQPMNGCECEDPIKTFMGNELPHYNETSQYSVDFNEEYVIQEATKDFLVFLDYLRSKGAPKNMIDVAPVRLEYFALLGYEPTVGDLLGLQYPKGLAGSTQDDLVVAGTVAAGGDPETGKIIASLLPKDFFDSTFGAVFANGFNLSCWNSTFTPSKVAAEVSKIHVPFFEKVLSLASDSQSTPELEKNFNYLLKAVDISYDMYANKMWNGANWRSCSREAIQIYIDIVTGAKAQTDALLANLQKQFNISVSTMTVPAEFTYPQAYTGQQDFTWSEKQHGNSTYRVIKFNQRIEDTLVGNNTTQKAGFGVGTVLLLAGIGFGIWNAAKKNNLADNNNSKEKDIII